MSRILTACSENGKLIVLSPDLNREELRHWRRTRKFHCPQCKSPVQLKVGEIVIPHFAHYKDSSCTAAFSEGESPQHLLGKSLLHKLLKARMQDVVLEPFLKDIAQRPDLLVLLNGKKVPIEFQCSTVPNPQLVERTDGYRKAGMTPIWILNTPEKVRTSSRGVGLFQFSKFQEWFIASHPPEGDVLLTFNPQAKSFHYFTSLLHVAGQRYIGMHHILPIGYQSFPFVRPKLPTEEALIRYAYLYRLKRKEILQRWVLLNRKGINDPFLRSCYEMRTTPAKLPDWIGVPIQGNEAFREPDVEWQMRLLYFMRRNDLRAATIRPASLWAFVQQFEQPSKEKVAACLMYARFLTRYGSDSPLNKTEFTEKGILRLISERFLANGARN